MLDIKMIRENPQLVHDGLLKRNVDVDFTELLSFDSGRRAKIAEVEVIAASPIPGFLPLGIAEDVAVFGAVLHHPVVDGGRINARIVVGIVVAVVVLVVGHVDG